MHEAADHIEHIVGMHRGKYQMPGQCGLHRDLRGLRIAYLAHHDFVRIVTQNRPQAAGEGQPFLLIHRNLQHAGELVFHRVFNGDDFVLAVIDLGDCRIQRGGFAGAGRARHQHHAVRFIGQMPHGFHGARIEAEKIQPQAFNLIGQRLFVENPQHRILAKNRRHDRHAEIHLAPAHRDFKASILRHPALGDIELGHHFNA